MRGSRLLFGVVALLSSAAAAAQPTVTLAPPPTANDSVVSGYVLPRPSSPAGFSVEVYETAGSAPAFVSASIITAFDADGKFSITVPVKLAASQWVRVLKDRQLLREMIVKAAPVSVPAPVVKLRALRPGDRSVSGTIAPATTAVTPYTVQIINITSGGHSVLATYPVRALDKDGVFAIDLNAALAAHQRVEVLRNTDTADGLDVPDPPGVRVSPPHPGQKTVAGVFEPVPDDPTRFVVEVKAAGRFVERQAIEKIDKTTGTFSVALSAPLRANQTVEVVGGGVTGAAMETGAFDIAAYLQPAIFDGAKTIHGYLRDMTGVSSVRVKVQRSNLENDVQRQQLLQLKATSDFDSNGQFTVTLDQPVVAGQVVTAEAATSSGEPSTSGESPAVTVTDPGSWGRARAYFAGGVVFSKDHDDFSRQDLSLAFVIDKGWLQKADFKLGADPAERQRQLDRLPVRKAECQQRPESRRRTAAEDVECDYVNSLTDAALKKETRAKGRMTFRGLNSFFDARLTALPVATSDDDETAPGKFVDSRKGAVVQIGAYAPFFGPQTSWMHEGAVNALFIAPVFRVGIQTIVGDGTGKPTVNAKGEPDDVFHFWSAGFGIGHQKLSGTTNQTPEVISYLHVTWGKSEAFDYLKDPNDPGSIVRNRRTMVEGRLKIPSTAMQIGFDANLGDGHDDVRFVFGTRFDIGELFGRLKAFQ